jgi:hypothetical protein
MGWVYQALFLHPILVWAPILRSAPAWTASLRATPSAQTAATATIITVESDGSVISARNIIFLRLNSASNSPVACRIFKSAKADIPAYTPEIVLCLSKLIGVMVFKSGTEILDLRKP